MSCSLYSFVWLDTYMPLRPLDAQERSLQTIPKSQTVPGCFGSAVQNSVLLANSRSINGFVFIEEPDLPISKTFPIFKVHSGLSSFCSPGKGAFMVV